MKAGVSKGKGHGGIGRDWTPGRLDGGGGGGRKLVVLSSVKDREISRREAGVPGTQLVIFDCRQW